MKRILPLLVVVAGVSSLLAACMTVPKEIPTTLGQSEYFQTAQQYSDKGNYKAALFYYETYIKRFPNDAAHIAEAQYEIAFIYFKMNDYKTSKELFTQLVDRYKQPGSDALPRWPLVLANKLILIIDQKTEAKKQPAPAS